jgi:flagellar protein FlaG
MSDLSVTSAPAQPTPAKSGTGDVRPEVVKAQTLKGPEVPEMPEITLKEAISKIKEAIEVLNETLASKDRSIRFRVDETIDRSIITVVDEKTGKVVRQLPSEEMLRVAHNIESLKGILIKEWV